MWEVKKSFDVFSPVVIMADLMAAGDQSGWADLMRATIPVT